LSQDKAFTQKTGGMYFLPFDQVEWEDAQSRTGLPTGVQWKVLREYPDPDDRVDFLVRFPPGYVEPEHVHPSDHGGIILEGSMTVEGQTFGPGTYAYGVGPIPHGPFEYGPEGCVLYGTMRRGGEVHEYEKSAHPDV